MQTNTLTVGPDGFSLTNAEGWQVAVVRDEQTGEWRVNDGVLTLDHCEDLEDALREATAHLQDA